MMNGDEVINDESVSDLEVIDRLDTVTEQLETLHEDHDYIFRSVYGQEIGEMQQADYITLYDRMASIDQSLNYTVVNGMWLNVVLSVAVGALLVLIFKRR